MITSALEEEQIPLTQQNPVPQKKSYDNENISTIDWRSDYKKEKKKRANIFKQQGFLGLIQKGYYASQGWILTFVVGVAVGIFASIVAVGMEWMYGLKQGVCVNWFFATKSRCCINIGEDQVCPFWKSWSEIVGVHGDTGAYAFDYFAFAFTGTIMALLGGWFVKSLAPQAAGSGIPEVKTILGGFVIKGCLGIWTLVVKIIGLVLTIGSGLTVGKEGPMVHVGGCTGNIAARLFPKYRFNEAKKREIISASCAAGVACAFGTPAGGTLFSLEELSSYFPPKTLFRTFFTSTIGALTLQVVNPGLSGKIVLYSISYHVNWKWFELLPFIFLGITGGMLGALFTKLNITFIRDVRKKYLSNWPLAEILVLSVVTSLLCYWNEYARLSLSDLIAGLFGNTCTSENESEEIFRALCDMTNGWQQAKLFLAFLIRFSLLIVTVGAKIPSGILVPALALGACYGHLVGTTMKYFQETNSNSLFFQECSVGGEGGDCIVPGMYALIGAATMLGGICRITVSLAVIMFELTGGLEYMVPIMLAVMFAKWVGDAFNHETIYEQNINMSEYPFLTNEEVDSEEEAKDIMTTHSLKVVFSEGVTVGDLKRDIVKEEVKLYGFPIIDNSIDRRILGFITQAALQLALKEHERRINDQTEITFSELLPLSERQQSLINKIDLSGYLDEIPIQVPCQMPGDRVYDMFRAMGIRYCLVLHNSKLVGIISKKDLARWAHNKGHAIEMKTIPQSHHVNINSTDASTSLNIESSDFGEKK